MLAIVLVLFSSVANAAIDNLHQVSPGIYRGARPDAEGLRQLARLGIKTIINLQGGDGDAFGELVYLRQPGEDPRMIAWERATSAALGMRFVHAPMSSLTTVDARTEKSISVALSVMATPRLGPVFVHCELGKDRTGLVIALHRVRCEAWSKSAAKEEWIARGHSGVNGWFTRALDEYFDRAEPRLKARVP